VTIAVTDPLDEKILFGDTVVCNLLQEREALASPKKRRILPCHGTPGRLAAVGSYPLSIPHFKSPTSQDIKCPQMPECQGVKHTQAPGRQDVREVIDLTKDEEDLSMVTTARGSRKWGCSSPCGGRQVKQRRPIDLTELSD